MAVLCLFLSVRCDKSYEYHMDSFIQVYDKIERLHLMTDLNDQTQVVVGYSGNERLDFRDKGEKKIQFDRLCQKHGDVGFDQDIFLVGDLPRIYSHYPDIVSMTVYSDQDFDEAHPAGTPLDDCINLSYITARDYIQSGYRGDMLSVRNTEFTTSLDKMTETDFYLLLDNLGKIKFKKLPEVLSEHQISVVVKSKDGQTFEDTISFDFAIFKLL